MTTTASKHGLKQAATERRTRHAQKTPLPPRERVIAEEAGLVQATPDGEGKSSAKARAFSEEISKGGWSCSPEFVSPEHVSLTAKRGKETIFIEWVHGVYQNTAAYTIADRTIKMRNASQAKQYAARTPEQGQEELEKVSSNRFFRKRETPEDQLVRRPLPFDPATAMEPEILASLAGRRVTWHNRFREVSETAIFPQDPRRVHFTEFADERIINFCCPATGFRSFRLSALLQVSRGSSAVTVRQQSAKSRKASKAGAR